jgi:hypothetical protein
MPTFTENSHIQRDVFPYIESMGVQCNANVDYWANLTSGTLIEAAIKIRDDVTTPPNVLSPICKTALVVIGPYSPKLVNDIILTKIVDLQGAQLNTSAITLFRFAKREIMLSNSVLKVMKKKLKGKFPKAERPGEWD